MATRKRVEVPPGAKLAYTVEEAGAAIGVGRSMLFEMIRTGELQARKIRGRTIITREELQRLLRDAPVVR